MSPGILIQLTLTLPRDLINSLGNLVSLSMSRERSCAYFLIKKELSATQIYWARSISFAIVGKALLARSAQSCSTSIIRVPKYEPTQLSFLFSQRMRSSQFSSTNTQGGDYKILFKIINPPTVILVSYWYKSKKMCNQHSSIATQNVSFFFFWPFQHAHEQFQPVMPSC